VRHLVVREAGLRGWPLLGLLAFRPRRSRPEGGDAAKIAWSPGHLALGHVGPSPRYGPNS